MLSTEQGKKDLTSNLVRHVAMNERLKPFDFNTSNLSAEWKRWSTSFKIYLMSMTLDKEPDSRKVALLIHHLGEEAMPIFTSFGMDIDTVKYKEVYDKFEAYFTPKKNIAMERHKLKKAKRR